MIDDTIKKKLLKKQTESGLEDSKEDLNRLIEFMESTPYDYLDINLKTSIGFASPYGVYLNVNKMIERYNIRMIWYIILHETGHMRRISHMGINALIKQFSLEDFDSFCKAIINEEIIADRYACYVYRLFMNKTFPIKATQQLFLEENQAEYKYVAKQLFGIVNNSEENYKNMVKALVYG